jgi:hypothetical protein
MSHNGGMNTAWTAALRRSALGISKGHPVYEATVYAAILAAYAAL